MSGYEQCQLHARNAVVQRRIAVIEEHASNDVSYPIDRAYKVWEFGTHEEYNDWLAETFTEDQLAVTDGWLDAPPEHLESAMSDDTTYELHAPDTIDQLSGEGRWPLRQPMTDAELEATALRLKQVRPDVEIEAVSGVPGDVSTEHAGKYQDTLGLVSPAYPNHRVEITRIATLGTQDAGGHQPLENDGYKVTGQTQNHLTGKTTSVHDEFYPAGHWDKAVQATEQLVVALPETSQPEPFSTSADADLQRQQFTATAQARCDMPGPPLN